MKIAFFSDCYLDLTGGIVSSINAQKQELERRGHTVYVFSSSYPKTTVEQKKLAQKHIYPVPSCKIWGRGLIPIARRPRIIENWLLKTHPEIKTCNLFYVHYEAGCSIAGLRLAKKLHIPSIQVMHGREDMGEQLLVPKGFRTIVAVLLNWFHSWYLPHKIKVKRDDFLAPTLARARMWTLMVNHANAANLVLTPSNHFRAKLLRYGVSSPVKVLPNGVPDSLFIPTVEPRVLSPGEPLKIIWHSRLSKEKRPLVFLKSLAQVDGQYHVDFYGDGTDYRRAQKYARKHHLNVTFHGAMPFAKIYPRIATAHLDVIVSSGYDTFGMTLVEAISAGTPVLFVDSDMKEIVPASAAIQARNDTATAIAAAISYLIEHPTKITTMSEAAIKHRNAVRVSATVDLFESYCRELLSPKTAATVASTNFPGL